MTRDYYDTLGLNKNASENDLKKKFKSKALSYHPNFNESKEAKDEFNAICEAYDVLSNMKSKAIYDLYGEQVLKFGRTESDGTIIGGFYTFNKNLDPIKVFKRFFGSDNPFRALDDLSEEFENFYPGIVPKQGKEEIFNLECTLEEVYFGCLKKMEYIRHIQDKTGNVTTETKVFKIFVPCGIPEGTKFIFEGEGAIAPNTISGPVIYVLKLIKDDNYEKNGLDLIYTKTIPLYHSLTGIPEFYVENLQKKPFAININDIITPNSEHCIEGEGFFTNDGKKGNFIIRFKIVYPTKFDDDQKMLLRAAFFLPKNLTREQESIVRHFDVGFTDTYKGWNYGIVKNDKL